MCVRLDKNNVFTIITWKRYYYSYENFCKIEPLQMLEVFMTDTVSGLSGFQRVADDDNEELLFMSSTEYKAILMFKGF